ncbi:UNVERIFIED_CONTAM: hypothetical protein H355_015708 [Colinus virginianus]|nr:hypothetical protein H355_015708 [Colinus virginianus]
MMHPHRWYDEVPNSNLGVLDPSVLVNFVIGYTPPTRMAREIMRKVAYDNFEDAGLITEEYLSEEDLEKASVSKSSNFVGVVFKDAMSYQLRFPDMVAMASIYTESRGKCCMLLRTPQGDKLENETLKTNQSVWEQLELTKAVAMAEAAVMEIDNFPRAIILIYLVIAFSPFGYYLAIHIVAEKERKLKEFLKILGLHDTAFWLSWVLLYTSLIFVMSILMAVIATASSLFPQSSAFVIFLLFFLYGLSSVFFALMLTPLFKKSKHVGIVEFLATLAFGFVGLNIVLLEDFPKSFVWLFSPLCQCSFLIGIAQVMHLEDYEDGATFSNLNHGPYPLFISLILLVLDSVFYLLAAVYLDQVIPGEFGLRRSSFFFMKPSFWSKHRKNYEELYENSVNGNLSCSEMVEPVPSEFQGKEAIRISCVQKTFRKKGETVEALRNLSFDIYEGQITALLGHSGTGKTTLMNILCGLCPPTDGFVSVYGHRVSEIDEMLEVRRIAGVCPQSDIHFDILTVEENLSLFAAIKGIPQNDLIQEVQKVLLDLDMQPIRDNQAKKLSGGQKRRLSVGIAVLGNPKVLLLDEPTAGMDPCSRHIVWNLLKNRKANRVTVFSTHFMDEADILAEATTSLIRQHIPAANLIQENAQQLVYTLPLRDMDKFAGLFSDLDTHSHLGVISYGVSMTTLEDVYLKLEVEAEIDQADYSVFSSQQTQEEADGSSQDDMEQSLLMLPEAKSAPQSNAALWKKQVSTIAKLHFLSLKRENKCVRVMLLLFLIFLVVQILFFLTHHYIKHSLAPLRLSPELYLLRPGEEHHKYRSRLLLQNSTDTDIDDIVRSLGSMDVPVEMFNSSDYISAAPHSAGLNVYELESRQSYVFTIIFNSTMVHSVPVLMNIVSNLLLRALNVTESIQLWSHPFVQDLPDTVFKLEIYFEAVLLGIIVTGMPPYFAMENAENRKLRAYTQLQIAGLYPSAYWVGQALVDLPLFFFILVLMLGSLFAFHYGIYFYAGKFMAVLFCLLGYVPSVVLFTYVVSFTFKKVQNTKEFWSFIYSVTALLCMVVTEVAFFLDFDTVTTALHCVFCTFVPIYPLIGCLICFIKCVVWLFLLRCFELKSGGRTIREDPFFRKCSRKTKSWKLPDAPHDEDEDVRAERLRVKEALSNPSSEEMPAILVSSLHKEYDERREFLLGRRIKKVATKHISLCVRKGEILGLLGPNGAGKSTLINMLVGEVEPTSGQVLMGGCSPGGNSEDDSIQFVGYCPQTNPLWPDITLQEHFEIYGAIKGMNQADIKQVIKCISSALDFKDHLEKTTKKLGVGLKRKLCFALSMLGSPHVTLLDEPSTGMDPKAKQRMWRAIRAAFKNKERAAILTTHYMEEADAVCDRVAILVAGQLRCIGTVQHLKSKFGRGYFLEMKLKDTADVQQVEYLQRQILHIFPNANRQESTDSSPAPLNLTQLLLGDNLQAASEVLVCSCREPEPSSSSVQDGELKVQTHPAAVAVLVVGPALPRSNPINPGLKEWITSAILLLIIQESSFMTYHSQRQEIPYKFLGRLDDPVFNATRATLTYTPATSSTRGIMRRVASDSVLAGIKLEEVVDEKILTTRGIYDSSIHFCFMLSSLLKQPNITSFVGIFLHIIFGSLGFMTLFEQVPPSLEWIFNLFIPYTFTAGISKIVKLEKYGPVVAAESYPFFNLYIILILDSILYLLLAIYFDKVLPGKYGVPYPPLFFLRPSYWLQRDSEHGTQPDSIPVPGCDTEPMPMGFEGKEAIRLYNIRKVYNRKDKRTEALRGLSFNIYEGQITALLGGSGSGKTALLNVLSGFSKPSAGSAVIYNYKVSEVEDMEGIQAMVGICPQFNLHFEALTVKENLRIFAHIKGIQWKEVEQEVQKVLVQLDLTDLQDVHADNLSGGQKRKLSLAFAILGDPQVLLLDEPMAGLDPCSRHHVWELLAERRAGRVVLICTQSVEEADVRADRKAFLSNGRLQSAGSSLYLKRKWGIGYHLRMCINDQCDPGLASSLVRRYIPNAVFKGRDGDELHYMLPLENTKSFPDLLGHLESSLVLGVVHYEVSRTTLADVLLRLEGKEDIDHKGSEIEDFIAALKIQNIMPEITLEKNITSLPRHNGAIKISLEGKHRHYTLMCGAEPVNCFPMLINTLSNTFLRLFNSTAQIRIWSHPFSRVHSTEVESNIFFFCLNYMLILSAGLPPFFAVSSMEDYKIKARAQLRLAGLFPSAYWCGQALVDVPFFWALMCLMFMVVLLFNRVCPMEAIIILPMIFSAIGYGVSLVFLVYLIALMFRKGRTNRYLWSFIFILVNFTLRMFSFGEDFFYIFSTLMPTFPLLGWLSFATPYVHSVFFGFLLCCLEIRYREAVAERDPIFRSQLSLSTVYARREVLGLLGPNGAGKSTTIRMISGDVEVTAGEVLLQGHGAKVLGCCPQEDVLWPDLTVLQHLEAYAAVRGVRGEDAAVLIIRIAKALDLQKCLKTPARRLSAGEARKLCFALSILGNPMVMLWDEPSVGMDVAEQRCLRYIGSPEELRKKFGMSYHLEVKPKDVGQSDALHSEIVHLFPGAARQKRISSLLTYKIPMEDVLPLSQAFSKLEAAKQNFRFEEYSLSLHTLQQVFMDFSRDLEEPDLEAASEDTKMRRIKRNLSVFQQTKILLWKNVLTKWRMKMQSFQEWMLSLLLLPLMFIVGNFMLYIRYPEVPHSHLGQLDDPAYNATGVTVAFTPITAATRHIMNTVAAKSVMTDACYNYSEQYCDSPKYWYKGFLSLQSSIDAAIIEVVANHSVWEEMKSIAGVRMKSRSVISSITLEYSYFMITIVMCFSSFMYFLSINVVREKKKLKVLMKLMGLHDMAFWLSWSLLYAVYVLILSCLLTALVVQETFYTSSFSAILLLFFLYGLACVHLVFMLCSLLRTSKLVGSIGFLITFLFGCLSLAVLIENLPEPLKWFLSLFCPFAFNAGIAKIFSLERYGIGFSFSNLMEESYFLLSTYIILAFDSVLYMLLAIYFDKVLQGLSLNIYEGQITALLGHSGAGKTTLLNVLSGLTLPSEGSATIYDYKLSEIGDREEIREMVGVCPQFNTQFEVLTVKENLKTFAEIKGIKSKEVEREVQNILELLDISNIQDTQAEKLSGGQKRKLSIGIAMLGNPQVLLLDEPTAGLDPLSRHHVWNILKEHRAGRVILFSTQFMDEADILADRKAFISHGKLKCVGSSLFLKNKWGIGYHLRIHVSDSCDVENVTSLVKQYIPNVIFSGHGQYELRYKLPLENMNKFPDLFRGLDSCSDLGIINYGVSMTTLEDVFLRLEEAAVDQEDERVPGEWAEGGARSPEEMEPGSLLLSDTGRVTVSGWALWRQQVSAMARVHFLKLKGSVKNLLSILLLYVVFLFPLVLQLALMTVWQSMSAWELSASRYFLPLRTWAHADTTNLLVLNSTGSGIEDFIHALESQDIAVEITSKENITEAMKYNGAIKVSREGQDYRFTIFCHVEAINCFPVLVNIISNALLRAFNSTTHIQIWNHPFLSIDNPRFWDYFVSFYLIYMLLLFPGFPPHFAMGHLQDYKTMGTFGYGVSIIFFIYLISFFFRKGRSCDFWSFILIVVCLVTFVISRFMDYTTDPEISLYLLSLLIPMYPPLGVMINSEQIFIQDPDFIEGIPNNNMLIAVFAPYIHSVLFIFLLRYLEIKYGRPVLRKDPIFRISPRKENSRQYPEEPEEEDEDVKAEREAVRTAIATPSQEEKSVIIVSNLSKEYKIKKAGSVLRKKKKMATRNISFCVKKGEVLGLLGPNGAGKSTAIKMIAGETALTAGQVLLRSRDALPCWPQDRTLAYLGHCPQEDPLWPALTVHEHLKVYAAVKGVRKEDMATAINRKMIRAALKTQETGAVLTTHYMEEAEAVCDRVAILVAGQLRCIGSIQYLKNKFGKGYLLEIKVKDPESTDLLHAEILRIFPSAARQERFPSLLVYKVPMEDALPLSQSFSKLEEAKIKFNLEEYSFSLNTLAQVFLELSREQEKENFDLTLDGPFEWKQLQQEDS